MSWVYVYYINKQYLDMFYSILSKWYGISGFDVLIKKCDLYKIGLTFVCAVVKYC